MLYQFWFGGILSAYSIWLWFLNGPGAVIALALGVGIVIAGFVTRAKIKREQAGPPPPPMSWD